MFHGIAPRFEADPTVAVEGMGERTAVAAGENRRIGGSQSAVDGDAVVDRQPAGGGEFGVRQRSDAGDDDVTRDARSVGQLQAVAGADRLDRLDSNAESQVDSGLAVAEFDDAGDHRRDHAAHQLVGELEHNHLAAALHGSGGHLETDESATDDDEASFRCELMTEFTQVSDGAQSENGFAADDRRAAGPSPSGQHQSVVGYCPAVIDDHRALLSVDGRDRHAADELEVEIGESVGRDDRG